MIYYYDLPSKLRTFVTDVDYTKLFPDKSTGHNLRPVDLNKFMKQEGLEWFSKRGLHIRKALLFKASRYCNGFIHVDSALDLYNDYGINIVLSGEGKMQWISDYEVHQNSPLSNIEYKNFKIIDNWAGKSGLVRVNVPHRIITRKDVRYCLSLRTFANESPKTFEEAMNLLAEYDY